MYNELEKVFNIIGYPYYRQGSLIEGDELPYAFYTFWNISTNSKSEYENTEHAYLWTWSIYFYTQDPNLLYKGIDKLVLIAKEHNFTADGIGSDINSSISNYYGRMINLRYLQSDIKR